MNYLKKTLYIVLSIFILIAALLSFLLATTPGIYTTIKLANLVLPGKLSLKKPRGRLIDHFSFQELVYLENAQKTQIQNADITWKPLSIIKGTLIVKKLFIDKISIHIYETQKTVEDTAKTAIEIPKLPVEVFLKQLTINELQIIQADSTQSISQLSFQASLTNQQWRIQTLRAQNLGIQHELTASFTPIYPYSLHAKLTSEEIKKHSKRFIGQLELSGNFEKYQLNGWASGPLDGTIQGSLSHGNQIQMHTNWQHAAWPISNSFQLDSSSGKISVTGALSDMTIQAQAQFNQPVYAQMTNHTHIKGSTIDSKIILKTPQGRLTSTVHIDPLAENPYQGDIVANANDLRDYDIPLQDLSFETHFYGKSIKTLHLNAQLAARYFKNQLRFNATYTNETLKSLLTLGPNRLSLEGKQPYPWLLKFNFPKPELLHPALQGLHTTLQGQAGITNDHKGQLNLTINPGQFHSPQNKELPAIPFQGGFIAAQLTGKGVTARGSLTIDRNKSLSLDIKLPKFNLNQISNTKQPVIGELKLNIDALDFLSDISPAIKKTKGQVSMRLLTQGTLANPKLTGHITLNQASFYAPQLDITYNPIHAELKTSDNKWTMNGSVTASGKTLTLSGQGQFAPTISGNLQIKAQDFPAIETAEYQVSVSPDISIHVMPNNVDIKGSINIPKAELKPISFSKTVSLSEDVVFVRKKREKPPFQISTDISLNMGENVILNVKGLTGKLVGGIRFRQQPGTSPFAVGELRIEDGKYQAYGQDLVIQEGQLLFSGGLITNPGIRVRAVRYFNNASENFAPSDEMFDFSSGNFDSWSLGNKVTVGIEVSGRVKHPKIQLFSIPSNMSQADILSMIILGRPANQAGHSGGQLLITALSAMDLDDGTKGTQLISQLKQNLGFDFNVQRSSTYNQNTKEVSENTSFVVGKSITKRLYMSYNIGLFQNDGNILTIKYLLNKYFSIQVTASDTGSGLDLLYNHVKD